MTCWLDSVDGLLALDVINGSEVLIKADYSLSTAESSASSSKASSSKERLCRVKLIDADTDKSLLQSVSAILGPNGVAMNIHLHVELYFNLHLSEDVCVTVRAAQSVSETLDALAAAVPVASDENSKRHPHQAKIAKSCRLARIALPCLLNMARKLKRFGLQAQRLNDCCRKALEDYLTNQQQSPKQFCVGDVFSVPFNTRNLTRTEGCWYSNNGLDNNNNNNKSSSSSSSGKSCYINIYYRVMAADGYSLNDDSTGQSFHIDPSQTTIEQDLTTINSRIPSTALHNTVLTSVYPNVYNQLSLLASAALLFNPSISALLHGPSGVGKREILQEITCRLGIHQWTVDCRELAGTLSGNIANVEALECWLRSALDDALSLRPCVLVLRNIETIYDNEHSSDTTDERTVQLSVTQKRIAAVISDFLTVVRKSAVGVVVFATASNLQKLSPAIQSCFQRIIAIEQPTERQRELIIASMLRSVVVDGNQRDALANQVAGKTPSMLFADLKRLIDAAEYNAWLRGRTDGASTCRCCHWEDFETVLPAVRKQCEEIRRDDGDNQRFTLSAVPDVCWADVGGLEHAKREIMDAIELPLKYPHLFTQRSGDGGGISSRSGLLFFGPPGTGKTLLAKAMANTLNCTFLSVKGPELMNMYIGETERNIRQLFATAKRNERCLIFFDELDSIAPRRDGGAGGGGGGVMHRVVSQLLAELDAVNLPTTTAAVPADSSIQQSMVFVVGATNRPDLIAPELLMPGRFERLVYLDVASSREEQLKLLQAVCRKIPVAVNGTGGNNINSTAKDDLLRELVEHIPLARWTGADFYAMCTDALTKSVGRTVALVDTQVRLLNERLQGIDNNCGAADDELLRKARKYLDVSGRKNITADVYLSQFASDDSQFQLTVGREDFLEAIRRLQPSVSPAELDRYRHLQKQFR